MPLTRDQVTVASRVMLPTYAGLFGLLGLLLILQRPARTSSDAFDAPRALMPIHWWGVVFLTVALLEVGAMILHDRRTYLAGLILGASLTGFWMTVLLASAINSPTVSFTSAIWVGGWILPHIATARSLRERER